MILQKEIKTGKATILVVGGLPKNAQCVAVQNYGQIFYSIDTKCKVGTLSGWLQHCNWKPLSFLKDITEDVAKELVEECSNEYYDGYKDYTGNISAFRTAFGSLHSLVEASCSLKNKYGEKPPKAMCLVGGMELLVRNSFASEMSNKRYEIWKTEQEKVFTNPFLFVKI